MRSPRSILVTLALMTIPLVAPAAEVAVIRSARGGNWSDPMTWEGGAIPAAGAVVLVRPGHSVRFDAILEKPIRALHVGGTLSFARDRDTTLAAGLIRVHPGDDTDEDGFDCTAAHDMAAEDPPAAGSGAALEVGTAAEPIPAGIKAAIRLAAIDGMNRDTFPALVCCGGGRLDLHGAPLDPTWVKLRSTLPVGEVTAQVARLPTGWRPGDQLIVTATDQPQLFGLGDDDGRIAYPTSRDSTHTEERTLRRVVASTEDGDNRLQLDRPVAFTHEANDAFAGVVANLSRNVVVESAEPDGVRGHALYHRDSAGSISYAEFRHLGKRGIRGRYNLHFHMAGDSMRGASVVGASFWDSHNPWITIHGTNDLVVRDCVGYRSIGHGFFLEDGTEVENLFDHNLAVQALRGEKLPGQFLPFDHNDGAGFWWGNSRNAFTRNIAVECDQYGYRFEMTADGGFDPSRSVRQPDGTRARVDVRTLPFLRFDSNEAHAMRRFGLNLGGTRSVATQEDLDDYAAGRTASVEGNDVGGVGPDGRHPFLIRDFRAWKTGWAVHIGSPSVLIDGLTIRDSTYGIWRCRMERHEYRKLDIRGIDAFAIYNPWGLAPSAARGKVDGLDPVDDLPPATIVTSARRDESGRLIVVGVALDAGAIRQVTVNGVAARSTRAGFAEWEAILAAPPDARAVVEAAAEDEAGNREPRPHRLTVHRGDR